MAKRKLEKEREMFMSKSLPGFPGDQSSIDNENDSDSDEDSDESDEKGNRRNYLSSIIFLSLNIVILFTFSLSRRFDRHQRRH